MYDQYLNLKPNLHISYQIEIEIRIIYLMIQLINGAALKLLANSSFFQKGRPYGYHINTIDTSNKAFIIT